LLVDLAESTFWKCAAGWVTLTLQISIENRNIGLSNVSTFYPNASNLAKFPGVIVINGCEGSLPQTAVVEREIPFAFRKLNMERLAASFSFEKRQELKSREVSL